MGTRETAAAHLFKISFRYVEGRGTLNVQLVHHHVSMPNSTLLYHTFDLIWRQNLQNEGCDLLKTVKLRLIMRYEEVGIGLIFSCFKIYICFFLVLKPEESPPAG